MISTCVLSESSFGQFGPKGQGYVEIFTCIHLDGANSREDRGRVCLPGLPRLPW